MSIVIVIAPHPDMGHTAWANLQQAGVLQAAPSRRERLTPLQIHELMLKTAQQRLGLVESAAGGLSPIVPTLEKLWTELATDLMLANVDAAHYGWQQELDAHTPAFWHRLDPEARFVLVYEDPAAYVARAIIAAKEQRNGVPEPLEDLLAQWHANHVLLLNTFYAMDGNAVLVHATEWAGAADFLGLPSVPTATPADAPTSAGLAPTMLRQLLQPMVQQHAQAHALWLELQAVAQCPAEQPASDAVAVFHLVGAVLDLQAELQNANDQCDDLRQKNTQLQQALNAEAAAQLQEAAAKAQAQKNIEQLAAEKARLEEQHSHALREAQEEAELLLTQLHQVQEELEKYHFKNQELDKQLRDVTQLQQTHASLQTELAATREAQAKTSAAAAAAQQALQAAQTQVSQLRQEQASMLEARTLSEQKAAEQARLAEQRSHALREAQEEAELLLTQLHQVQEELENYFLKYQEQKAKLQSTADFWQQQPQAEVWADMRYTPNGGGWYEAEADGRWSGPGNEAFIDLPLLTPGSYLLELHIADAMDPDLVASMQLTAQFEDGTHTLVDLVHEFGAAPNLYPMVSTGLLQLPACGGSWKLHMVLPRVICPADQGGSDTRSLGLRLQGVRLSLQANSAEEPTP